MKRVDVLVVGGGIAGVGIAQFAAAAGYSVALIERQRIGEATSGNSSKLIHGGLRYLETMQLDLVRKSLKERRALLQLAPSLVTAVPFYFPVYRNSRRGALTIRAGLSLYGLLSEFDALGRFKTLSKSQWSRLQGLNSAGLETVFQYWDAQTDDRLLCEAVAHSAILLGTDVFEWAEVEHIQHSGDGCQVSFTQQGQQHDIQAGVVINACGPWVNQLLERVTPTVSALEIDWVQGAHLLLDIPPVDGVLYLESPIDQRVVFVMPWYGKTLVGTTETRLTHLDNKPAVTEAEKRYLLALYAHYFPDAGKVDELEKKVTDTFCGVRVLPRSGGDAFHAPRDTLMHTCRSHPRLLSLYGGKLTTFRSSAAEVLDWVRAQLGDRAAIADVDKLPLTRPVNRDDFMAQTG
ncbi:glycerol-3-phosphate dehydrogenase/oxidase [Shewanella amazonensis]|uniref:Glycerol-3-phosphate dehydrogenase n=1 Tax=Shewanella amazonensis (strain ATCC BAA-1098 / SB2B) TaxID=326297 RepID=A1S381_SHEAM|nr:FAD-dependent oxidoreductase [Shewanella amazonensis]ABL98837.1 glycerol-3-phosphate dehydrogenase [Shewanella amazonensis SB2B]